MRWMVAACAAGLVMTGVARAQSSTGTSAQDLETGYVEGNAQSAFGNVTSQSFGAEAGMNYYGSQIRFFIELGRVSDTSPDSLGATAQIIASYLTQTQTAAVTFSVRQPVLFFGGGVRYVIPYDEQFKPYLLGGFGLASVKRNVHFTVGGTDVTDTIGTYGVVLGSDLSGSTTSPMLNLGGGVLWNARSSFFVDLQYRFGRVFDDSQSFNVNRLGVGLGLRF